MENTNAPENQPFLTCQLVTAVVKLSGIESVPNTYFFFINNIWVPEIRGICLIDLFIFSIQSKAEQMSGPQRILLTPGYACQSWLGVHVPRESLPQTAVSTEI